MICRHWLVSFYPEFKTLKPTQVIEKISKRWTETVATRSFQINVSSHGRVTTALPALPESAVFQPSLGFTTFAANAIRLPENSSQDFPVSRFSLA